MQSEVIAQQKITKVTPTGSSSLGGQNFVTNLSTQSFLSIFNQVQQENIRAFGNNEQENRRAAATVTPPFNPNRIAVDLANASDEKQQKAGDAFDARIERQQEKLTARAQDYQPQKFEGTFLGTMIAIMEAQQNDRSQPLFSVREEKSNPNLRFASPLDSSQISTDVDTLTNTTQQKEDQIQSNPSLRLVVDGVPSQTSLNPLDAFSAKDLSEQDLAVSYIFGGQQFPKNHQQLKELTEAQPQNVENNRIELQQVG